MYDRTYNVEILYDHKNKIIPLKYKNIFLLYELQDY